jgi:hypothetical protein
MRATESIVSIDQHLKIKLSYEIDGKSERFYFLTFSK